MSAEAPAKPLFGDVPVSLIDVPADHELRPIDDDFKNSIKEEGLLDPILVRKVGDGAEQRFDLIDGGRRLQAVKELGQDVIAAQVRGADDTTRRVFRTIKNVQRDQFHPLQEAREYELLATEDGLSNQDIGRRIGRSALHVTQRRALLTLPASYQKLIHSNEAGALTIGEALELARLVDEPADVDKAYNLMRAGTAIDKAVQAQLQGRADRRRVTEARDAVARKGATLFEGQVGRDGWVVTRDEPAPGYLYWPEGRPEHESFQVYVADDATEFLICTNPLLFMQDEDPAVAASAAALAGLGQGDTADNPATPITADEAAKRREAAERKHFKEMRRWDELREEHLTKRVRGRVTSDQHDMIFQAFVRALSQAQRDVVYARCNVARIEIEDGFGVVTQTAWDMQSYLAGRGSWLKLAYAACLQVNEDELDGLVRQRVRMAHGEIADRMAAYLEHLEGTGYTLAAGERELAGLEEAAGGAEAPQDAPDEGDEG